MDMPSKSDHDMLIEIHAAIYGTNGQGGCYRKCEKVRGEFYLFRRWVYMVAAFLVGAGLLSFGVFEVVAAMGAK